MGYVYKQKGSPYYTIGFSDENGRKVRKSARTKNKAAATMMLADEERAVELRRLSIAAPSPMQSRTPIMDVIKMYIDECIEMGNSPEWIQDKGWRLNKVVAWTGVRTISELDESALRVVFDVHLRDSARSTRNGYLSIIRGLCEWAIDHQMIASNPTLGMTPRRRTKRATNIDQADKRRCLWTHEIPLLLNARPENPVSQRAWDNHRRPVYVIAMGTGLRRTTLAKITSGMIKLDVANPHIAIPGELMKSGRQLNMPVLDKAVRTSIEQLLRRCSSRRVKATGNRKNWADRPFTPVPKSDTTFRSDTERAEIPRVDEDGRLVVFHSLRATFATQLALNGAKAIEVKELMDHQKIETTMKYYTMVGVSETFEAMRKLPSLDQERLEVVVKTMSASMSIA